MQSNLGHRLRKLRKARDLTLAEVAQATGMSVAMLSRIERDERYPSSSAVMELAAFYGVPEEELLAEAVEQQVRDRWGDETVRYLKSGPYEPEPAAEPSEPSRAEKRLGAVDVQPADAHAALFAGPGEAAGPSDDEDFGVSSARARPTPRDLHADRARVRLRFDSPAARHAYRARPISDLFGPEKEASEADSFVQTQRAADSTSYLAMHNWVAASPQMPAERRLESLEEFARMAERPLRVLRHAAESDPDPAVREAAAQLLARLQEEAGRD